MCRDGSQKAGQIVGLCLCLKSGDFQGKVSVSCFSEFQWTLSSAVCNLACCAILYLAHLMLGRQAGEVTAEKYMMLF